MCQTEGVRKRGASVGESEKKRRRIVATSVHETANLWDSDEPVCTTGYLPEERLRKDPNVRYEFALISDSESFET